MLLRNLALSTALVVGVPAKVLRELSDDEVAGLHRNARVYTEHRDRHRDASDVP